MIFVIEKNLCDYTIRWKELEDIDILQVWLPKVKNKSKITIKLLYTNKNKEFILAKSKELYKNKSITIKYTRLYKYKKNKLAKQK